VNHMKGRPCPSPRRMVLLLATCALAWPLTAAPQEPIPQNGPYPMGPGVKPPVILSQPLPAYTDEARTAKVEGTVLLHAVIRKDGTIDNFKVIKGLGYGLDESAIATVATRWRFQPATNNGEPVDVQANIEVSFRLYHSPEEQEMLKAYPLRAVFVDARWEKDASGNTVGSGYGNLSGGGSTRGFTYTTSCAPGFQETAILFAKWMEPETRLVVVTAFNRVRACEFKVTMQNAIYTLRDGQVITVDRPDSMRQ
jgi:TonB family protein